MSGGSYDYVYLKIEDAASGLRSRHPESARHRALAAHLDKVAAAMQAIEWVDSCDDSPGDEFPAIDAVLDSGVVLEHAISMAQDVMAELGRVMERAREQVGNGEETRP